jgi:long-chain acyl-CoA synthetase
MLLNEFLEESAALLPDKTAVIFREERLTYKQIDDFSNSFARALIENGLKKRDRVLIYLDNSTESIISLFGALKAGGVFVMMNSQAKAKKIEYILHDCQPKVLITDSHYFAQIKDSLQKSSDLNPVVLTDYFPETPTRDSESKIALLSYHKILKQYSSDKVDRRASEADLASLIYTSGSSGNPKGIMMSHRNMTSAASSIVQYLENRRNDIIINTLPLSFDYGLYQALMTFKFGGTLVLEKRFIYPEQTINLVIKEKVTGWPMVPTMIALLLKLKDLGKRDFSNLRYISSTGQALPPKHIFQLRQMFPRTKIFSMYGLTECKRVSYLAPEEVDKRPSSVGKAMPDIETRIVDEEGKEIAEAGKAGELTVRGPSVMQGYWNMPLETAKALRRSDKNGNKILYTGDLFKVDEEGFLYFVARKDDMIKTSGHLVSPKEVENVLCEEGNIIEAAVIGVKDEILGQAIKAFVHVADNSGVNEQDIIRFCKKHLEDYAVPRVVVFCDSLPKTENGKILKRELVIQSEKRNEIQ